MGILFKKKKLQCQISKVTRTGAHFPPSRPDGRHGHFVAMVITASLSSHLCREENSTFQIFPLPRRSTGFLVRTRLMSRSPPELRCVSSLRWVETRRKQQVDAGRRLTSPIPPLNSQKALKFWLRLFYF